MFDRSESFFTGSTRLELFYQIWKPQVSKGNLIITHGQAEHSECYLRLVSALSDLGYTIYAWDLQGHGRSEGKRGFAKNFTDYVRDLELFIRHLKREHDLKIPQTALLGHSMGALIQTKMLLDNLPWSFKAQVLASPMFGIAVDVPLIKDVGAILIRQLWPSLTLNNEIKFTDLTRDPNILNEFEKDVMRHDKISSGVYLGSIETMEIVKSQLQRILLPTLMQIPQDDPVTSSPIARKNFERLGSHDKTLKEYSGFKHELYNEVGRDQVYADLLAFLKRV